MSEQTFSRSYHSELRAEQAQRTRERIMQAAAHEFGTSGYQATTMAAIARSAGVSTETVKAAGSKAELLIRSFETVFALQEEPTRWRTVRRRPACWMRASRPC